MLSAGRLSNLLKAGHNCVSHLRLIVKGIGIMKPRQFFPLLRVLTLALLSLHAGLALALGLGELRLHSALNEQLEAEIELVSVGDAEQHHILVSLASKEEFAIAGVPWEYYLTRLKFKTDLSNPARPVIRVSTDEVVKEPYLDFVVQLHWPSGKLLREYTVFLDLPVFDPDAQPRQVAAPAVSPADKTPARRQPMVDEAVPSELAVQTPASGPVAPPTRSSVAASGSEYRVRGGDTLWHIASRLPMPETTVYQRMSAIHRNNSSAFAGGDMNRLLKGAVLRIPSAATVMAQDANQAFSQVKGHTLPSVPEATTSPSTMTDAGGNAEPVYPPPLPEGVDQQGVLKLSVGGDDVVEEGSEYGGAAGASGNTAQSAADLLSTQEELDKTQRENIELKSKLANLEQQLETMSRMLELESDELRAAQLATQDAIDQPLGELGDLTQQQTMPAEPLEPGQETELFAEQADEVEDPAPEVEEVAPGSSGEGEIDEVLSGEGPGTMVAFLRANALPIGGFALVVLIIAFLFSRSRDNKDPAESGEHSTRDRDPHFSESAAVAAEEVARPDADAEPEAELPEEIPGEAIAVAVEADVEGEQVDPLSEADIYLSMDDFGKAEQVVEQALGSAPEDVDLHLKRLEIIAAQEDLERFDVHYAALAALGDSEATARADRMRSYLLKADTAVTEPAEQVDNSLEAQVAKELGVDSIDFRTAELAPEAEPDSAADPEFAELELDAEGGELELDLSDADLDMLTESGSLGEPAEIDSNVIEHFDREEYRVAEDADGVVAHSPEASVDEDDIIDALSLDEAELDLSDIELDLPSSDISGIAGDAPRDGAALLDSEDVLFDGIDLPDELAERESGTATSDEVSSSAGDQVVHGGQPVFEAGDIANIELDASIDIDADTDADDDISFDLGGLEFETESELDSDELLDSSDTQLELARAYIEMGDEAGARDLLTEVIAEGSEAHKSQANELLAKLSG